MDDNGATLVGERGYRHWPDGPRSPCPSPPERRRFSGLPSRGGRCSIGVIRSKSRLTRGSTWGPPRRFHVRRPPHSRVRSCRMNRPPTPRSRAYSGSSAWDHSVSGMWWSSCTAIRRPWSEDYLALLGYAIETIIAALDVLESLGLVDRSRVSQGARLYQFTTPAEPPPPGLRPVPGPDHAPRGPPAGVRGGAAG